MSNRLDLLKGLVARLNVQISGKVKFIESLENPKRPIPENQQANQDVRILRAKGELEALKKELAPLEKTLAINEKQAEISSLQAQLQAVKGSSVASNNQRLELNGKIAAAQRELEVLRGVSK